MRKIYPFLFLALISAASSFAQAPQSIPYQAVARDASGNLMVNQNICVQYSIYNQLSGGTLLYQEHQTTTTNNLGLFTQNVGAGTYDGGTATSLSGVAWGSTGAYIEIGINTSGTCGSYTNMGRSQMLSVPYALYAGGSASACPTCATTTNGGALSATAPVSISAAGNIAVGYDNSTIKINGSNELYAVNTGTITGTGSTGYDAYWTSGTALTYGPVYENSTQISIGSTTLTGLLNVGSSAQFQVSGAGNVSTSGTLVTSNTTASTTTTTGAFTDAGGAGIAGALNVGTTSYLGLGIGTSANGNINANSALSNFTNEAVVIGDGLFQHEVNSQKYPYYDTYGGWAAGWNTTSGSAEVDFWNTYDGSATPAGFNFYQQTGASAKTLLMSIAGQGANAGRVTIPELAGTGYRPVYADASGNLYTISGSSSNKATFSYNGSSQTNGTVQSWTVPTGVNLIFVKIWGGGGGSGYSTGDGPGGGAGFVSGFLSVTPGNKIYIVVGAGGQGGTNSSSQGSSAYGGGGAPGQEYSGGGGGYSGIFSSSTISQATAMAIAGGGGGGGKNSIGFSGGGGGGLIGVGGCENNAIYNSGTGGTQIAGGVTLTNGGVPNYTTSFEGGKLSGGGGSTGAQGSPGGGGGWYGGGAGGISGSDGGAGGGSSYISGFVPYMPIRNEQGMTAQTYLKGYTLNTNSVLQPGGTDGSDYVSGVGVGGATVSSGSTGNNGGNGYVVIYY